jgi:hypothetical protein
MSVADDMFGLGSARSVLHSNRKTLLLVDSDPHAQAALRNAVEAAGFSRQRGGERTRGRAGLPFGSNPT